MSVTNKFKCFVFIILILYVMILHLYSEGQLGLLFQIKYTFNLLQSG